MAAVIGGYVSVLDILFHCYHVMSILHREHVLARSQRGGRDVMDGVEAISKSLGEYKSESGDRAPPSVALSFTFLVFIATMKTF